MAEGSVKQRLAAVLAADVAGYSRLMGDDERATIATLDEYRAVLREHIESNDGRVIDMAGDSVLAVFDSANAAVRAAIDAQAELGKRNEALSDGRRMEFRIGVNSGDIQEKSDGTVYGDGVNVAARLEAMANPGGINVSGSVFDSVRSKIGTPFDFLGEHEVKNIAEPVRAYRVLGKGEKVAPHRDRRVPLFAAGIAAFVLLAVGLGSWWLTWDAPTPEGAGAENIPPALPDKPSIAVLSFENLSADAAHDYLSEGMTEEIISALSHFRELFVIARSSTSGYDGKDIDIRQVARELGVRYVLDGSIRASGDKLRVSAQLVDAADGSQAWSQPYERSLTDIFAVQSDIAGRIATILVPKFKLEVYARTRSTPTIELTAYEHVVRALRYWDNETPETHLEARNLLEEAVRIDPNYARAYADLVFIYEIEIIHEWNVLPDPIGRMERAGKRAIELDPMDSISHAVMGDFYYFSNQPELFETQLDRALELNPNDSETLVWSGMRLGTMMGRERMDKSAGMVLRGMRLNPNHPRYFYFSLAQVLFN